VGQSHHRRYGVNQMDAKLRQFLRERAGLTDEQLDKLDLAALPPTDGKVLRKGASDIPPIHPKALECFKLLYEMKASLDRILKADALRGSVARGAELFDAGKMNGFAHD
jgi:hypothetical protein